MRSAAIGIDLGTTYSAVAVVNEYGVPEILPNAEGARLTPSVILFEDEHVVVGAYAQQASTLYPEQVVHFVKRHMGDATWRFDWRGKAWTPQDLSHLILAKLKADAEAHLGVAVTQAVITVPAYFDDRQRRATLEAGRLAGLEVLSLLNEPTAAAFAYGLHHEGDDARVLVFDLGGGTFDVTIVDMGRREINVRATRGDPKLGGKDWDDLLIDHVAGLFLTQHGVDPRTDSLALADLRAKAERDKKSLSRRPSVRLLHDMDGLYIQEKMTRDQHEALTKPLLDRCEALTRQVVAEAGLQPEDIHTVLLAGGSTRMPMVRSMLNRVFGKAPATDINPDEAIALGAALTAAIASARRSGQASPIDIRTHDVTSHSLGMAAVMDGHLQNLSMITRNTRIPAEFTRDTLTTTKDGQTSVDVWLLQGDQADPVAATALGRFEFYGIPPRPAGETHIAVTYRYSANAIVELEAMDLASGQTLPFRVASSKVSLADVASGASPFQLLVLVDSSGSMFGPVLEEARAAASKFAASCLARKHRKVAVIACPGGIRQMPTRDLTKAQDALKSLHAIGGSPLGRVMERAHAAIRPEAGMTRWMVVYTDGRTANPAALQQTAQRIAATGTRVLTVACGDRARTDVLAAMVTRPEDALTTTHPLSLPNTYGNVVGHRGDAT
ncbi:MAG: Hsp70 family protein [Myxococcota bacterium]